MAISAPARAERARDGRRFGVASLLTGGQDGIKRLYYLVHVLPLDDKWRQEAQCGLVRPIDDDVAREHFLDYLFGQVGGIEIHAHHEPDGANILDLGILGIQLLKPLAEIFADLDDMLEHVILARAF